MTAILSRLIANLPKIFVMVQNSLPLRQDIGFRFIENLVVGQFETGGALQKNKPHQFPAKARNGEEDYFILYPLSNTFAILCHNQNYSLIYYTSNNVKIFKLTHYRKFNEKIKILFSCNLATATIAARHPGT